MTLHVFLRVVTEFLSSFTQSTSVCYLPDMALHVYCLVIPEDPSEYFIHQESSLPPKDLKLSQKHVKYFWPPSVYSFNQGPGIISFSLMASLLSNAGLPLGYSIHHNFLLQGAFNRALTMLDIANLHLTIPFIRNHFFIVYTIASRSCWLLLASLLLFIISFLTMEH